MGIFNLKFQLTKFEKALAFQIIEQTEEWNSLTTNELLKYTCKNYPWTIIKSCNSPELAIWDDEDIKKGFLTNRVCLHGVDKYNNYKPFILNCYKNFKRDKYYDLIIEALKEWSLHVYQLRGIEPQKPKREGDRYVI